MTAHATITIVNHVDSKNNYSRGMDGITLCGVSDIQARWSGVRSTIKL